jgi:6,7-dimethyl-8-ribityllumazine synthase
MVAPKKLKSARATPVISPARAKFMRIAIVQSAYHENITTALEKSCRAELLKGGVRAANIKTFPAAGAFELPYLCSRLAKTKQFDAVIALGCIIRGETPHFDFIASAVAFGIIEVSLQQQIPVIFGVLTVNNLRQAQDRIRGGKRGDKGLESARAALQTLSHNF